MAIEGGPNPGRGQTGKTPGGNNNTGGGQTNKQPDGSSGKPTNQELENQLDKKLDPEIRNRLLDNKETLDIVSSYGDDAIELVALYGDNAVDALPNLAETLPPERLKSLLQKINSGEISGDLSETLGRVANGGTNTIGAVGELDGFVRATERGYDRVESIKPPESGRMQGQKGEKSP